MDRPTSGRLAKLTDKLHIQTHLALTELRLRARNNSNPDRVKTLDILHKYWKAGVFPQNIYTPGRRVPVFIDQDGTYCAVGYLMAKTGHSDLAVAIDNRNKFTFVEELDGEPTKNWLQKAGLTKEEAALIQPGYPCGFGNDCSPIAKYNLVDAGLALLSIAGLAALTALLIVAIRIVRNGNLNRNTKLVKVGALTVGVLLLYAFFLPNPKDAATILYCAADKDNGICLDQPARRFNNGGNSIEDPIRLN